MSLIWIIPGWMRSKSFSVWNKPILLHILVPSGSKSQSGSCSQRWVEHGARYGNVITFPSSQLGSLREDGVVFGGAECVVSPATVCSKLRKTPLGSWAVRSVVGWDWIPARAVVVLGYLRVKQEITSAHYGGPSLDLL